MSSLIQTATQFINSLPHRHVLKDEDVARWVAHIHSDACRHTTVQDERERILMFHLNRLAVIGGSDIGTLIATRFPDKYETDGVFVDDWFRNDTDIINEKLCRGLPESADDNHHLKRGIEGEKYAIAKTIQTFKQYTPDVNIDEQAMELMRSRLNHPNMPWLEGNPDLILQVAGKRILIDIKCPAAGKARTFQEKLNFDYVAQLHHYNLVGKSHNPPIHFDTMVISAFDWDEHKCYLTTVEHNPALEADLITTGNYYYQQHILTGIVPYNEISSTPTESAFDYPDTIKEVIHRISANKIKKRIAENAILDDKARLENYMATLNMPRQAYQLVHAYSTLRSKVKTSPDLEKIRYLAEREGLLSVDEKLNEDNIDSIIKAMNQTETITESELSAAFKKSHSFDVTLSRKKGGYEESMVSALTSRIERAMEHDTNAIVASMQKHEQTWQRVVEQKVKRINRPLSKSTETLQQLTDIKKAEQKHRISPDDSAKPSPVEKTQQTSETPQKPISKIEVAELKF